MHRLETLLRVASKTSAARYYLSPNGQRGVGPFPMSEVKWMIRCRHFSPDVLIRPEDEPSWTSYRYHTSQAIVGKTLCLVIIYLLRLGILKNEKWTKWTYALTADRTGERLRSV